MEVTIKKMSLNTSTSICMLPKNIFTALNLSIETPYTFHFGLSTETSAAGFLDNDNNVMYFSEDIFNNLKLLQDITINIWKTDKDIFLGPVVGLLSGCNFMANAVAMKESTCLYIKQHTEAGLTENCFSYFFCVDDVDLPGKKIKGFTFIPELNKYDYRWFPLPEVVYRKNVLLSKNIRELLRHFTGNYNIKLINNCTMLGKWELYEVLCKYPEAKRYVPETIVYRKFDDVLSMLNKHGFIFIKSSYGLQGKEVLSVEKLNDKYKLNYFQDNAKEDILDNIDDLKAFVTKYVAGTKFIVQQGIKLLKYKGCTIDLRLLMMKDEYGRWESIYRLVRIAKKDFNITTAAGRRCSIYEKILPYLQEQYRPAELPSFDKLDEAARVLSGYIEVGFGSMGEMGLDIGIDMNGGIWIIEANSDPLKNLNSGIFDIDGDELVDLILKYYKGTAKDNRILPQLSGIFKYSKFLAGARKDQIN